MTVYTIGFTKKTAEQFFELLKSAGVELLVDVRLNNRSQLSGFAKDGDIQYFLRQICGAEYVHCDEFAPSEELLSKYRKKEITWEEYKKTFDGMMEKRGACKKFPSKFAQYDKVCLLCSEPTPEHCHRRLVAEKIADAAHGTVTVRHL